MIKDVGYIISSHINYQEPLNHLLQSMQYIPPEYKFIGIGGASYLAYQQSFASIAITHHNSYDYTGLIEYIIGIERGAVGPLEHVFLLHDTMEFSIDTDILIKTANPDMWCTAIWGGQCNLMLLRTSYILQHKDLILSWINCSKDEAVKHEGELFRICPDDKKASYIGDCLNLGVQTIYNGAERVVEHYTGINLRKYKANWGQSNGNWVVKP